MKLLFFRLSSDQSCHDDKVGWCGECHLCCLSSHVWSSGLCVCICRALECVWRGAEGGPLGPCCPDGPATAALRWNRRGGSRMKAPKNRKRPSKIKDWTLFHANQIAYVVSRWGAVVKISRALVRVKTRCVDCNTMCFLMVLTRFSGQATCIL